MGELNRLADALPRAWHATAPVNAGGLVSYAPSMAEQKSIW